MDLEGQAEEVAAPFVGIYRSVWQEDGGVAHAAVLKIDLKPGCDGIFAVAGLRPKTFCSVARQCFATKF